VAGGAIVLAITYLIVTALQTSTVYYITVGELLQRGPAGAAQQVRVAGHVVPGSVEKIDAGLAIRFLVHDGSGQMPVFYKGGPVPDIYAGLLHGRTGPGHLRRGGPGGCRREGRARRHVPGIDAARQVPVEV
jgi:hypothetical protein